MLRSLLAPERPSFLRVRPDAWNTRLNGSH